MCKNSRKIFQKSRKSGLRAEAVGIAFGNEQQGCSRSRRARPKCRLTRATKHYRVLEFLTPILENAEPVLRKISRHISTQKSEMVFHSFIFRGKVFLAWRILTRLSVSERRPCEKPAGM